MEFSQLIATQRLILMPYRVGERWPYRSFSDYGNGQVVENVVAINKYGWQDGRFLLSGHSSTLPISSFIGYYDAFFPNFPQHHKRFAPEGWSMDDDRTTFLKPAERANTICPLDGGPAFQLFSTVECENEACRNFPKWRRR